VSVEASQAYNRYCGQSPSKTDWLHSRVETAVHEDRLFAARKNDIRRAQQIVSVQPEPDAFFVKKKSNLALGCRGS
jgi:hypothetical protein